MRRTWIKLYVEQTLRGSIIEELKPEWRWMFIGLLLLAGDSEIPGIVYGRKDEDGNLTGKPAAALAYDVGIDEAEIAPALARMAEKGKIFVDSKGVISICNWNKYQSEYERKQAGRTNVRHHDGQKYALEGEGEGEVEGEREEEKKARDVIEFDHGSKAWKGITSEDVEGWKEAYPACDVKIELKRMREWILGAGAKGQKRAWRKFIVGWLKRTQADGGTKNGKAPDDPRTGMQRTKDHDDDYWAKVRAKHTEGKKAGE